MATFDVVTIGGAVRDITFYTTQGKVFATPDDLTAQKMLAFEYGAKIYAQRAHYELGGGALNAAVSLSRLRLKTAALVRLGNDQDAADVRLRFKREQVCPDFIQVDPKAHTGFSLIVALDKREHEHVAFLYRGANENLTAPLGFEPLVNSGYIIKASNVVPREYRVIAMKETEKNKFAITALFHDKNKYARVERDRSVAVDMAVGDIVKTAAGNEDVYIARYERHNREVMEYFANRPGDLLVLDLKRHLTVAQIGLKVFLAPHAGPPCWLSRASSIQYAP